MQAVHASVARPFSGPAPLPNVWPTDQVCLPAPIYPCSATWWLSSLPPTSTTQEQRQQQPARQRAALPLHRLLLWRRWRRHWLGSSCCCMRRAGQSTSRLLLLEGTRSCNISHAQVLMQMQRNIQQGSLFVVHAAAIRPPGRMPSGYQCRLLPMAALTPACTSALTPAQRPAPARRLALHRPPPSSCTA